MRCVLKTISLVINVVYPIRNNWSFHIIVRSSIPLQHKPSTRTSRVSPVNKENCSNIQFIGEILEVKISEEVVNLYIFKFVEEVSRFDLVNKKVAL